MWRGVTGELNFKLKQYNLSTKHTSILIGLYRITTKNLASELKHVLSKIYQTSETSFKVYMYYVYIPFVFTQKISQ